MEKYARFKYMPSLPLGEDGKRVTACREHIALAREAAAECMVLLKNENNALPLKNERVALFGKNSVYFIAGGGGSGAVNVEYVKSVYDGLKEKEKQGKLSLYEGNIGFYNEYVKAGIENANPVLNYVVLDEPELSVAEIDAAASAADTAVITIGRFSEEGGDRKAVKGDYYLSDTEQELIKQVSERFKKTVLVLNIGAVMDCEFFADNDKIQAILCCWQPGMEGGAAVADILCGDKTPSGRLADTFARSYDAYPSTEDFAASEVYLDYSEDIYVGYRYFETVPDKKGLVRYPFGYGLSYTSFELSGILCGEENGYITVAATVRNIGMADGKEVVQIYFSAPHGLLGKPNKQLIAFKKTRLLKAGESEVIAMRFKTSDMASFDDLGKIKKSAYVLEKGDYELFIGGNVRECRKIDYVYSLKKDVITEQLNSYCAPSKLAKRMLADGTYENLPSADSFNGYPHNQKLGGTAPQTTVKFDNVGTDVSLDDFISQLTDEELTRLVGGTPGKGIVNTACFGGLDRLNIPHVPTADGPAGLRIDIWCGVYTTAWPVATALACSWNEELVERVGQCAAKEVKENNFGIWLTPAINIHRDPLCGRNFEYFSEDPLVAGKMAAAKVRGIQSQKIAASVKHFACNSKELNRKNCDSRISERALREIYLKGFKICVEESDPWTVMSSYNLINGRYTSENWELLTGILRNEFGFNGMITTDWRTNAKPYNEIKAGNDMKMPYGFPEQLQEALERGELERADLEACVKRILLTYIKLA